MAKEKYTGFEEQLNEALKGYEVAYDPAAWASMEKKLDAAAFKAKLGKAALLAAGVALVGGITFYSIDSNNNEIVSNNANIVENTVKEKTTETNNIIEENAESVSPENNITEPNNNQIPALPTQEKAEEKESTYSNSDEKEKSTSSNSASNIEKGDEVTNGDYDKLAEDDGKIAEVKYDKLNANFTTNTSTICQNETVEFTAEDKTATSYKWEFGDGNTSNKKNPTHVYKEAGSYTVTLTVEGENNAKAVQTLSNAVTVSKLPVADFDWETAGNNNAMEAPTTAFTNKSFDAEQVTWDFGNGRKSTEKQANQVYTKKGNYKVTLTVISRNGCKDTKVKMVEADGYNLLAPTGFSPNGDGINDKWIPVALRHIDAEFTLNIIDQAGQIVFTTSNKNNEWDGRKKDNRLATPGETFGWVAIVKDKSGTTQEYAGSITIK